jgi:hypothetical protein
MQHPMNCNMHSDELENSSANLAHRPFTSKDINKTMRDAGIARAGKYVGESVFDNDALASVVPILILAMYIAQSTGYRTVHPCHIEMAHRHIYNIEQLPTRVLQGLHTPKKQRQDKICV